MKSAAVKRLRITLLALVLIGAVFSIGVLVGYEQRPYVERVRGILNMAPSGITQGATVDFDPFWKAWRLIQTKYVAQDEIDKQALVWGAISGMAKALGDPYTVFLPPKENEMFESDIKGEFEGIGAEIGIRKNQLVVISPLEGSPAKAAGLKAGDKILKIDDFDAADIILEEAVRRIRGKKGTTVVLTVFRGEEDGTVKISIVRNSIKIPVLETSDDKESGIFTIRLFNFSAKSPREFEMAIRKFAASGHNKLILDLRDNPGGFLDAAIQNASWFLPEGDVVTTEKFRNRDPIKHRSRGYAEPNNLKMVVLVNHGSASASEILAGALQEHGVATIIGTKTFGKGSVQELVNVTSDTALKITIARWLTPNGRSISQEGLDPDILITDEEIKGSEKDVFMKKAREFLLKN